MFPKTRSIEQSFQYIRLFTFAVVIGSLLLDGIVVGLSYHAVKKAQEKVYILAYGRALEAIAGDRKENIPVEARDHIGNFHHYFFTLDPDEKVIQANLAHALYLADASANQVYDNLKENGYYSGIVSGNISQTLDIDSIVLDTHFYPFYFRLYGKQKIVRPTSRVTRNLLTEGWLRNTSRSDNNPHGYLIERWRILDNTDIKSETR